MRAKTMMMFDKGDITSIQNSAALNLDSAAGFSVQVSWSGSTPSGTLKLQGSNDGSTWTDLAGQTVTVTGNSGSGLLNVADSFYNSVRAAYTQTSGTGTLTAIGVSKGV